MIPKFIKSLFGGTAPADLSQEKCPQLRTKAPREEDEDESCEPPSPIQIYRHALTHINEAHRYIASSQQLRRNAEFQLEYAGGLIEEIRKQEGESSLVRELQSHAKTVRSQLEVSR